MDIRELRYYQKEAEDRVMDELILLKRHSTLLIMATASGKTVTFAHIANAFVKAGKRVLIIAHREELISQAVRTLIEVTGLNDGFQISVEKANENASLFSRIVVASVQTLKGERLTWWRRNHFQLIIIDEAHHTAAESYLKIIERFNEAKVLGVTATPDRLDKKGLGQIYDSIAYVYDVFQGIKDGFLSPIISKEVRIHSLDLSKVRKIRGDYSESDLEKELITKPSLYEVAKPTVELSGDRPTIVFGVTVAHARELCEVINTIKPFSADYLHGKDTPERRAEVLQNFREGKIQYLCNCLLFTEGVDLPFVSCIACARPTTSRAMYCQFIGRGMRICDGKENCLIIDFTDNSSSHKLVCTVDVLAAEDEEEVRIKEFKMEEVKDLPEFSGNIEDKEEDDIKEIDVERRRALEQEEVRFKVRILDPFAILGINIKRPKITHGGIPPTQNQKDYIAKHGLWREDLTRRQAALICQKISERLKKGLCTPSQARLLSQYGFNPNYTRVQADAIITEIKRNNWKISPELKAKQATEQMKAN